MRRLLAMLLLSQCRLFQHVLCGCQPNSRPWFANAPLGHNSISEMMPKLSVSAHLSKSYTNHCVRATVVTDLMDARFSPHKVWAVMVHKNAQSLEHYDRLGQEGNERPSKMAKVRDGETLTSSKTTKLKPSTKYAPHGTADGGRVFDKIVLNDHAVIHHLTINVGTTTELQQQQLVSSSRTI